MDKRSAGAGTWRHNLVYGMAVYHRFRAPVMVENQFIIVLWIKIRSRYGFDRLTTSG